jgi:hypothetical protein
MMDIDQDYDIYDALTSRLIEPHSTQNLPAASLDWTRIRIPQPIEEKTDKKGISTTRTWMSIKRFIRELDSLNPSIEFSRGQYKQAWTKGNVKYRYILIKLRICLAKDIDYILEERIAAVSYPLLTNALCTRL